MTTFHQLAFTEGVKALQTRHGSRAASARTEAGRGSDAGDRLGPDERAFLAERDSFYLASVGETGWPYVQHRGGPRGFVKVLDDSTLAFADYAGNRQYISVGNVGHDDRVALVFVDYPNRARLKLLAHARIVDAATDPDLVARVSDGGAPGRVERVVVLTVAGLDWNCSQHIVPRYTEDEVRAALAAADEARER
ncbi:MAG: pyridoxamine 5'-phosphate oxidase family protein [Myxococcota bacterium]